MNYIKLIFDDIHYNFDFQIVYVNPSLTYVHRKLEIIKEDEMNKIIESLDKKINYLFRNF